jgi:DNA-binding response OmpR family regulator
MNVLVIDDEKEIREIVSKTLTNAGYDVTATDNVVDAVKLINSKSWDLVISDIMIPHLGGFEIVDHIKDSSNTPVIVMTGMDKDVLMSTLNKADHVLTKPFSSKDLLGLVKKELA